MSRFIYIFLLISSIMYSYPVIGGYYGTKETDLIKPTSVKIDSDGNIYINDFIGGKTVSFTKDKRIRYIIDNLDQPSYISIINTKLYITFSNKNKVMIFDTKDGKKIGEFGSFGMRQGEFKHPSLVYEYEKEIYIIDELNFRIQVLDQNNNFKKEILLPKFKYFSKGAYAANYQLVFDKKSLLVLDKWNKKIYKYENRNNIFLRLKEEVDIKYTVDPCKMFAKEKEYYIYDRFNKTFYILDEFMKKKEEKQINDEKESDTLFSYDYDIAEDKFHLILDGDYFTYSINEGKLNKEIDFGSVEEWEYIEPVEVRTDSKGNILVLDRKLERINVYDKKYKFIRNYKSIGKYPTGFSLDEFDNIYVAAAGENSVKKISPQGDIIYNYGGYGVFDTCFSQYYDSISDEEKEKRKELKELMTLDGGRIFSLKIIVDKNGYIYVMDNKRMKISVFDQFFNYQYEFGKKATIIQLISGKKEHGTFGWDEKEVDSLKDLFYYEGKVYVLDNLIKRINKFNKKTIEKIFDGKFSNVISNIYINKNVIAVTDSEGFKIVKYNMEFAKQSEESFLNEGIMPMWYNGRYLIGKHSKTNYQFFYKVYDLEGIEDDRNKKTESNIKEQKNNRGSKS